MLMAFADHASLALSDSRRIEAMRERDAERIQARFRALVQHSSDMIMVVASDARDPLRLAFRGTHGGRSARAPPWPT